MTDRIDRTDRTYRTDRIDIIYICSQHSLLSLTGRFPCISIRDSGLFTILTDEGWVHLKAHTNDLKRLKGIASRDKGSIYLRIRPSGVGYVLDEEPSL